MRIYSIGLTLLVCQSPTTKNVSSTVLSLVLLMLSPNSPLTRPCLFATAYICEKLGGLERKLKEQR